MHEKTSINTGWLTVTRKCNSKCAWCYTKNELNCSFMDYKNAKIAVDNLFDMGGKKNSFNRR